MSNRKSTDSFYKRLIPMAESTISDDTRKNRSSGYHRSFKNTTNSLDRQTSSHSSPSNLSTSLSSVRGAIDAQTYVDAQSNGLTQRIVRYDEENKKTPNVYNRAYKRAGDFPIVHLDKPKLVLTPKRSIANPPKMARIGQPDPCINRTSIRAEILRNGTMMPVVSLDRREDVDNVRVDPLDALKEISRKRIHCEDTINQIQPNPTLEKDTTDSNASPSCNNSSKRQRITSSINSPSATETNKRNNSYSKSNEILSSLSSSSYMLSDTLKRAKVSSPNNSISPPQAKRLQTEKLVETPTVDTPVIAAGPKPIEKVVPEVVENTHPSEPTRPKLTLFNRPYSSNAPPALQRSTTGRGDECNIPFVKPRPMTVRQRESTENWFKVKPDDKRRLSLMLKCLSGEVDVDNDTVDSGGKITETPKPVNTIAENRSSLKPSNQDQNATEKSVAATVVSTTQIDIVSKTSTELPTKPAVTFNPVLATTAPLLPTATPVKPAPTLEERKGGFSFPIATKTTTPVESNAVVKSASPLLALSSSSPAVTVTQSIVTSSPNPTPKAMLPTVNTSVSFTLNPSKPNVTSSSPVVRAVEPTKTFTFGNASNVTNDPKNGPAFGISTPSAETAKTTSSTLQEPVKATSFGGFGQTTSTTGNIDFGKNSTVSTAAAPSVTFDFGSTAVNKAQPPSFGSIQTSNSDKDVPLNKANDQTSVFGNTFSNNPTSNAPAQKPADPRISNIATSFSSHPGMSSTSTIGSGTSFVFGASTNTPATTKTPQTVQSSTTSFGSKPTNSTSNIFGSMAPQQQQPQGSAAPSIFGTPPQTTNLFAQAAKVDSTKSTEPQTNVTTQSIFGSSSAAKPASTFAFSANTQSTTNNVFGGPTLGNSGTGNSFNFGGSIQKPDSASSGNSLGSSKSFNFSGNNSETKPVAFGTNKSVAPTFGTTNVVDSAKTVGFAANNQTSSTNLFTNTSTNQVPQVFSFGGTSNPASTNAPATFGGTNSTFGSTPTFGAATPTFGGAQSFTTSANATPAFGSTNSTPSFGTANATPTFGNVKSTPTFGSAHATPTFGNSNATPSFTSASATPTFGSANSITSFGSANATPSFGTANATPSFGTASATPSFGTANATPSFGTANATPSFGTANATPSFGTANATPSFGTANATPSFGTANATPSFGTTNATPSFGTANATPSFGGFGATGFTANNGAPSFGTNSNNNSAFGGNSPAFSTSTGTADVNRTFNFTGTDPAPSPVPNLFNIGPGNSAPRGRTIRTATRRTYR